MAARGKPNGKYQGMKWCRTDLRISLYIRDGLACVYCGAGIEDAVRLTLDHLIPYSQGGTNAAENLVTCCNTCNAARGNRDWREFAGKVAEYLNHGITGDRIIAHIDTTRARAVNRQEAKNILARRGGFTAALQSLRNHT